MFTQEKKKTKEVVVEKENTMNDYLPDNFEPTNTDVVIGRGKKTWNHEGNRRFRHIVQAELEDYSACQTKQQKTEIILGILKQLKSNGIRVVKQDLNDKWRRWINLSHSMARVHVAQAFRDALANDYKSSRKSKQVKRKLDKIEKSPQKTGNDTPIRKTDMSLCDAASFAFSTSFEGTKKLSRSIEPSDLSTLRQTLTEVLEWLDDDDEHFLESIPLFPTTDPYTPIPLQEALPSDQSQYSFTLSSTDATCGGGQNISNITNTIRYDYNFYLFDN